MRSLQELSYNELRRLNSDGHIGEETKNIAELENFFNTVKYMLNSEHVDSHLPRGEAFTLNTPKINIVFKVNDVLKADNLQHITHILNIDGCYLDKQQNSTIQGFVDFENLNAEFGWNGITNKLVYYDLTTNQEYVASHVPVEVFDSIMRYHSVDR